MQYTEIDRRSDEYPDLLKEFSRPPKRLFVDGVIPKAEMVAIVGSRKPSPYGVDLTYHLAYDLAKAGAVIVSGLAIGIDAVAHRAALEAGGQTIAVLGCGLDVGGPATNSSLRRKIPQSGAVISEYELGMPGLKQNFPARNRIVAGLSRAIIVTEAKAGSGALITAAFARDDNRMVMALPGNVTSELSVGPNNLIRQGAIPITTSTDVIDLLNLNRPTDPVTIKADGPEEALIMKLIRHGITTSEEMIEKMEISASQFAQLISLMEVSGKVKSLGAGHWSLSR